MKARDRFLTGFLLLLIGVLIGTLISLYQEDQPQVHSKVDVTEIKRDRSPVITDSVLQQIDSRFLLKEIVNEVRPTVVYIESEVKNKQRQYSNRQGEEGDIWDRLFPNRKVQSVGSGVIISSDGYILTNNHVIDGAEDESIQVVLYDKREFEAQVVGRDPSTDLAVLKIPPANLPAITVGDSDNIEVGEWVIAIGNPFRLRSTVTAGIVSALHRNVQILSLENELGVESFIQTDAAINKGNSGGALVNTQGRLIGINTAIASQNGSYQGYGFAVPVNLALKVARDLIEFGEVQRAILGIRMRPIDYSRSQQLGLDKVQGVEIVEVLNKSAADVAGLKLNDAILAINGNVIQEPNELQQQIAEKRPGEQIVLSVWREGRKLQKQVRLKSVKATEQYFAGENQSQQEKTERENPHEMFQSYELGLEVMSLAKPEDPRQQDLVITRVYRGTNAWKAGLRKGGIIERVDGEKVESVTSLRGMIAKSLQENGEVSLFVELDDHTAKDFVLKRTLDF